MSFGKKLKKLRQDENLTQEELAKKINSSRSNIANYENDKNMPSVEILEKLSKILNCSIDYLLGNSNVKNSTSDNVEDYLLKIGLDMKKYNPPTENQKKQIEEFAKLVLKDNKKEN